MPEVTTGGITLFTPENPIDILLPDLYDPMVTPATGHIIPVVGCLVIDPTNCNVWVVTAVNPTTHVSTLAPARMFVSNTNPTDSLVSVISYGNDIFRLYYDLRTSPVTVRPDSRIVIFGADVASYQIVQNPGSSQVVVSRHYDSSGNYTGSLIPAAEVVGWSNTSHPGASYLMPGNTQATLTEGEELFLQVFNSQGAQIAQVSVFAKQSVIINEMMAPFPVITAIDIISNQGRSNNEIFIFQGQSITSLGLQVRLTYENGYTRIVPIDQTQTFLYGTEDFVASFPGLRQTLVAKYFLSTNETMSQSLAVESETFASAVVSLVVVPNGLQAGVKISVIPVWNSIYNRYGLNYFLYSTTRDRVINVSSLVTISGSTPFNPTYYGQQVLTLRLDMSLVEPTIYTVSTVYQQTEVITLQPLSATDRYTLKDATTAPLTYGVTTPTIPRPVIHFDTTRNQYYIPSSFTSQNIFLQAFYTNSTPVYDTSNETHAPIPTHFQLRDPTSGVLLTSTPIPIVSYNTAFSIIGAGLANRYIGTGKNVIVEFVQVVGPTTLILQGVPVDTYTGTYSG